MMSVAPASARRDVAALTVGHVGDRPGELESAHQHRPSPRTAWAGCVQKPRASRRYDPGLAAGRCASESTVQRVVAERAEDLVRALHDDGEVHADRARRLARVDAGDAEYE